MQTQTINASARSEGGKGVARKLRSIGLIPAVAYGEGKAATSLALDPAQLRALRKTHLGWNHPVRIEIEGGEDIPLALLRDVQRHPISGELLHADFRTVRPTSEVVLRIPLRLQGRAVGQEIGGLISTPRRDVKLACLPDCIPVEVPVDITPLEIGDKIMLDELTLPEGCRAVEETFSVASCVGRRGGLEEEELEDDEEAEAEAEE